MKIQTAGLGKVAAIAGGLLLGFSAVADTTITGFDDFFSLDGLFAVTRPTRLFPPNWITSLRISFQEISPPRIFN